MFSLVFLRIFFKWCIRIRNSNMEKTQFTMENKDIQDKRKESGLWAGVVKVKNRQMEFIILNNKIIWYQVHGEQLHRQ